MKYLWILAIGISACSNDIAIATIDDSSSGNESSETAIGSFGVDGGESESDNSSEGEDGAKESSSDDRYPPSESSDGNKESVDTSESNDENESSIDTQSSAVEQSPDEDFSSIAESSGATVSGDAYWILKDNADGEDTNFTSEHIWNDPWTVSSLPTIATVADKTEGENSLKYTFTDGLWSGVFFKYTNTKDLSDYAYLAFDIKTTSILGIGVETGSAQADIELKEYADIDGNWNHVVIPLSDLSGVSLNALTVPFSVIAKETGGEALVDNVRYEKTGTSTWREFIVVVPDAPSGLNATATDNAIDLNWTDNSDNESGFNVYWSKSNSKPTTPQTQVAADETMYTIINARAGTEYFIWVSAIKAEAESDAITMSTTTSGTAPVDEDFTVVVIPDTQFQVMNFSHSGSGNYPTFGPGYQQFHGQMDWVVAQKDQLNIQFVAHVGDAVDHVDYGNEWTAFKEGWSKIEASGIPWAIAPGNHDGPMAQGNWNIYNNEYPAANLLSNTWMQETYPSGNSQNNLSFFEAGGMEFMVVSIGYSPDGNVWGWADGVLKQNSGKRAIINTHDVYAGSSIVDLAKQNENVMMVVSGHYCSGAGWNKTESNNFGGTFQEIMSDYQCHDNGTLRYYTFKPSEDLVEAVTYNPMDNRYTTDGTSSFTWNYTMN